MASDGRDVLLQAGRCINEGRTDTAIALLDPLVVPERVEPVRLRYLATAYRIAGRLGDAEVAAGLALAASDRTSGRDPEERIRTIALLGRIAAAAGHNEGAIDLLERCLSACDEGVILDPQFELSSSLELAHTLDVCGRTADAASVCERARRVAGSLATAGQRAERYAEIATAYAARGDAEKAIYFRQRSVFVVEEQRLLDEIASVVGAA